jgi:hypothetical protein
MRLVARWGTVVVVSMAAFALSWWVCRQLIRMDEASSLGIAGAVLTLVLAVTGWWAPQVPGNEGSHAARWWLIQKARAGRNVNLAGRDQMIIYTRGSDE